MAKRPAKPESKPKPRPNHDESRPWSPDSPQREPKPQPTPQKKHSGAYHDSHAYREWLQDREIGSLEDLVTLLFDTEEKIMAVVKAITDAQNRLAASLAQLESDVAALKAAQDPDTAADNAAIAANLNETADRVDALDATIKPAM
jgi:hypothetical protein